MDRHSRRLERHTLPVRLDTVTWCQPRLAPPTRICASARSRNCPGCCSKSTCPRSTRDPTCHGPSLRALSVLSRRGALNLSALARWTQASLPSASRLVDRLEAGDLVERATHPTSRREIEIRLTAAGRGVLNDVRTARRKRLRKTLVGMEPTQVSALLEGLEAFARSRDAAEA
nr:MarR family transcriptional regulator [Angustibacter aerolatus]